MGNTEAKLNDACATDEYREILRVRNKNRRNRLGDVATAYERDIDQFLARIDADAQALTEHKALLRDLYWFVAEHIPTANHPGLDPLLDRVRAIINRASSKEKP